MPRNSKHTAPTTTAAKIADFDTSTKILNLQNTDAAVNMRVGFAQADLITDGMRVLPGETYPIPLDGNTGGLWLVSEGAALTDKAILVQG